MQVEEEGGWCKLSKEVVLQVKQEGGCANLAEVVVQVKHGGGYASRARRWFV